MKDVLFYEFLPLRRVSVDASPLWCHTASLLWSVSHRRDHVWDSGSKRPPGHVLLRHPDSHHTTGLVPNSQVHTPGHAQLHKASCASGRADEAGGKIDDVSRTLSEWWNMCDVFPFFFLSGLPLCCQSTGLYVLPLSPHTAYTIYS